MLPGVCDAQEEMHIVVESSAPLPITLTAEDNLAIGIDEEERAYMETCSAVMESQEAFRLAVDWTGGGRDEERI